MKEEGEVVQRREKARAYHEEVEEVFEPGTKVDDGASLCEPRRCASVVTPPASASPAPSPLAAIRCRHSSYNESNKH